MTNPTQPIATSMKERPILFNATMVRAILDGSKWKTRRMVKPQPTEEDGQIYDGRMFGPEMYEPVAYDKHGEMVPGPEIFGIYTEDGDWGIKCPYGQPGDQLWVRETHAIVPRTAYRCSNGVEQTLRPHDDHDAAIYRADWERSAGRLRWRPSIHMPRWASRIQLEITGMRVERLQDISEEDAIAEGINGALCADLTTKSPWVSHVAPAAVHAYAALWESINGAGSWDENPWVWVVEFKRLSP